MILRRNIGPVLSRSSLREAVKALSLVNILDVRRGDGTYVTSLEPPVLLAALSFSVDFHRDTTVLEFLRVRRILEPAATAMAAERITPEEIESLRRLLDSVGPEPEVENLVANDLEFTVAGVGALIRRWQAYGRPSQAPPAGNANSASDSGLISDDIPGTAGAA